MLFKCSEVFSPNNYGGDAMAVLLAEYEVLDLKTFRRVFAELADVRKELGATGHHLMAPPDNPSFVAVMIEFVSADDAKVFSREPRRLEALKRAGVTQRADVVLEEIETQVY
jgi:hypothetical protein